jgi:hypothetical protein
VVISPALASPTITTAPSPGGPAGTTVADTATLSGGSAPTGTIEFTLYGPSATADCSGPPVDDEFVPVSGNGNYTTPTGATPPLPGTYWWIASYGGDGSNNPVATTCGTESVIITDPALATPTIMTTPSPGGPVGTTVTDTATLSGGSAPTGTIEFALYGPSATPDCSAALLVFDQTVTVAGDANYTSPPAIPPVAGTYQWVATYGGDGSNNPAATACGDEPVTISP